MSASRSVQLLELETGLSLWLVLDSGTVCVRNFRSITRIVRRRGVLWTMTFGKQPRQVTVDCDIVSAADALKE